MATYSDFLLFHWTDQGIRPSLIDPHGYHLADAAAKLRALAAYAARHAEAFLRIQAVVETPERRLLAPNLKSAAVREAIADLRDEAVLTLFAEQGGDYQAAERPARNKEVAAVGACWTISATA